ncbi:hypothetical protein M9H77_30729 [Catharanthus roseus]|uniref:Uncharacterized protein n=1 Tax=Catharanthus roseus TaxID=4058 RepID=A0ACB9ZZD7_CATRO|nr:hypothetical protein M9H77_30729 [Catharanthus roseus]
MVESKEEGIEYWGGDTDLGEGEELTEEVCGLRGRGDRGPGKEESGAKEEREEIGLGGESRLGGESVLGDCPNRPLVVLPSPAAPTKTFAVRDFLLPFPTAVPLRDGVAGIGLLFPRLPVSIRPTHPVLPPFLPKLPPPLDYPLPEKGAAEKVAAVRLV